ncbi:hypothetical protein DdX_20009 [Ditylenchus destructor]|uniref:Uncharacterized protein n=1 Tax=Ditylenchus destructor TaxID=166010 RepID=A0AAD4MJF9_9BILA|nr:hypothetical protein DdX_20009 [Ditylenchus destructor]
MSETTAMQAESIMENRDENGGKSSAEMTHMQSTFQSKRKNENNIETEGRKSLNAKNISWRSIGLNEPNQRFFPKSHSKVEHVPSVTHVMVC